MMGRQMSVWIVLAAASAAALAQYSTTDPRSNIYNNESLRRADEIKRNEEAARRQSDGGPSYGGPSGGSSAGTARDAAAAATALRRKLLALPPLPDERNPLLGRWRVESDGKPKRKDDMGRLMGMLANPGGAGCEMVFGSGTTEFKPKSWGVVSGHGADSLGPIVYRGQGTRVWAIPDSKVFAPLGFELSAPHRAVSVNLEGCVLTRAGEAAAAMPAATVAPKKAAGASTALTAGALPQVAAVAPSPPPSTLSRPSPEVCRNTLLDQLGKVGTNQVRAMSDVRFKEAAIEGKVPNTNNLRIDLRGSACDDPRIKATLYDFDANEMLQSITYVWDRPPGPAPAPIFAERVTTLSRFHPSLPQPQTSGRLQGDTSLGRLVLQDMPERNLLLEAYAARR